MAKRKARFLEALKDKGTYAAAARAIGVSENVAYKWRKDDAAFAERAKESVEVACDIVEAGLVERAVNGVARSSYYKGVKIGEDREFDTKAAEIFLKARRPQFFGDRIITTHQGPDGGPLTPSLNAVQLVIRDADTLTDVRVGQKALPAPAKTLNAPASKVDDPEPARDGATLPPVIELVRSRSTT